MVVTPINGRSVPIESVVTKYGTNLPQEQTAAADDNHAPSFLDVFTNIVHQAAETNAQKSQDMIDLMLGSTDDLELIQTNIAKAQIATDLLVTVKNSVVDTYNEIIRMQV